MTELDRRVAAAVETVRANENRKVGDEQRAVTEAVAAYRHDIGQDAFDLEALRSGHLAVMPVAEVIRTIARVQVRLVDAAGLK